MERAQGHQPSPDLFRYKGVKIKNANVSAEAFERPKRGIVDYIITCIGQTFSTFSTDPVILAAEVFDPANFPSEENLEEFGDAELH